MTFEPIDSRTEYAPDAERAPPENGGEPGDGLRDLSMEEFWARIEAPPL